MWNEVGCIVEYIFVVVILTVSIVSKSRIASLVHPTYHLFFLISFLLTVILFFSQILIFYGPRSNGEFLVHNGFVYADNEHDRLCLKLGLF